ncbi:DUF4238 domain-containing protein [Methylacidiphilum caldifontis]|uniref:DUF4238 domain-containing protein n=1 Tax=Methylacidiphilum caldifontis TaxID=2795386 RepID=UPI001A8DC03E|nr:DUF4238 domain-containing protein [Methylacidiphilum caldifontis]QSR89186.1 DUF4238 domain-containing protein [Methylacidiphilum caldifontis]
MSEPKYHHFVPVFYLKHFVGKKPQGHIWTYDSKSGDVWSSLPENTACVKDYYSIKNKDGKRLNDIEKFFSRVESDAAPIYENLLRGVLPTEGTQERFDFSLFLALMVLRTQSMRCFVAEIHRILAQILIDTYRTIPEAFDTLINRIEEKTGDKFNKEDREYLYKLLENPSWLTIHVPKKNMLLPVFTNLIEIAKIFDCMKWSVVNAIHGFFITSDNPVIKILDPKFTRANNRGFLNENIEIIFPLSSYRALLMTWYDQVPDILEVFNEDAWSVNKVLAANSEQYLYAHLEDKRIKRLAKKFNHPNSRIIVQGFCSEVQVKGEWPRR